jgi:HK97 family phage prohead protease
MNLRHLPIEFRLATAEDGEDKPEGILIGYAAIYDETYRIGYSMKESITAGAFDASIASQGGVIPIFYAHSWSQQKSAVPQAPIGVGYVTSDKKGVKVRAELFINDNPTARSVYLAAAAGALREWSVGHLPITIRMDEDDDTVEHIDASELLEASVCLRGANPKTEMVQVRSEDEEHEETTDENEDEDAPAILDDAWALLRVAAVRESLSVLVQSDGSHTASNQE